ncbi:F-box protein At5g49610 [Amborella trichopoda]|uniref:F-box protein At5g49610 n=1 Tax=Amborella trichopoda TaxID=13333 RepID=UPI0009BF0D2C|nr:F-box protein At5g49610 [Amborella trichopoda]|eukprot:XP_011628631.2 F-box protein At5g49610 [Amborella trichopoda]
MGSLVKCGPHFCGALIATISGFLTCLFGREKKGATGSPFCSLPDDIVIEILAKIPMKSICRFQAVSKSWESLLSSHHFAVVHSISTSQYFSLFLKYKIDGTHVFYADAHNNTSPSAYRKTEFQQENVKWVACSNGLVCCLMESKMGYYLAIGNPLIQSELIPLTMLEFQLHDYGFYFDPINQNFKILVNADAYIDPSTNESIAFLIFDSSVEEWRLPRNLPQIQIDALWMVVSVGSCCYGFSSKEPDEEILMAFDMEKEEWEIIHTPVTIRNNCSYKIQERDNELCLIQVTKHLGAEVQADIWVLHDEKKWVQVMRADLDKSGFSVLDRFGLELNDFLLFPDLWVGETLFLRIQVRPELSPSTLPLHYWNMQIAYDRKSGMFSELIVHPHLIGCFVMHRPTLFICKLEKDDKICISGRCCEAIREGSGFEAFSSIPHALKRT